MRRLLLVCAVLMATLPASASGRGFMRGFGYGPGFGPWGYYGYGGLYGSYSSRLNAGEVRLDTHLKDADVFINGAYAGTAGSLKSMWLSQGAYSLEVRAPGRGQFNAKIYVLGGKTMRLRPELRMETKSPAIP